jgi:microcystin degradation protein MlrC
VSEPPSPIPRIALLGFSIECNRFAPVATEADFLNRTLIAGAELISEARAPAPRMLGELPGFVAAMDAAGDWEPVPSLLAMAEPNGPVEQAFFDSLMERWQTDLSAAGRLDGVYAVLHGAGLTTGANSPVLDAGVLDAGVLDPGAHDPEGTLLAGIRRIVGPRVPVVATYDLHANVSDADVALVDGFIGYRTNPHLDMRERGAEAADLLRRLIAGTRTYLARIRLPIVPPTVTQLTGRRTDRPRPAAHASVAIRWSRAERLGHGRLRLCRYPVQRPDNRGDGHRPGRRGPASSRDRASRLGQARPLPPHAHQPGGRRPHGKGHR